MTLHDDAAYRAVTTRDARFDGRLFVGVTSTRVYCRPVCRVRTPRRENCRFYANAALAEAAGFRPCLRCRRDCLNNIGWCYYRLGRHEEALPWLERSSRVTLEGWMPYRLALENILLTYAALGKRMSGWRAAGMLRIVHRPTRTPARTLIA